MIQDSAAACIKWYISKVLIW